jgi:hypothetical protein
MNLSFTQEYYPSVEELTPEQITAAREQIVTALRPFMPDVDLTPGTPTGDFVVTPMAVYRAAAEEANNRLMSDLDLANVADGLIYSCEFVKAYLGNFAVYDVDNLRASGLVRLTFTSPLARDIARTIRFQFNTEDDWTLMVADPNTTVIKILQAGSAHNGQPDTYVLAQTTANTWAVDVPVEGVLSAPIEAGTAGAATEIATDLVGIAAAIKFMSGVPSASLPDLARMARKIAFSITAGSRASTKALVYRNWPESNMVSPVVPGDDEMQRMAALSPLGLQSPAVDLYFRSARDMQRVTQNIRLDYVNAAGAPAAKVFRGVLPLLHRPSRILGIEWSGTSTESKVINYRVFSKSERADLFGSSHCGTRFESLYAQLVPVLDGSSTPLIPLSQDVNGQYAIFTITYDCDPLLETVSSLLESPEYRPAGVDVLVKSGPLVLFEDLAITYVKKQGVKTTLNTARERIVEYLRTAGHPDDFRVTELYDIVRNAGADKVLQLTASGQILVSAANKLFRAAVTSPLATANWDTPSDWLQVIPFVAVEEVAAPAIIINGPMSPGGPTDIWAATNRTVRYATDPSSVRFIETS